MADLRLPDGSRVNATLPPATIDGPTLSIRRFGRRRLRRDDLLNLGTLSPEILEFLVIAVRARKNILISGGTGAGKVDAARRAGRGHPVSRADRHHRGHGRTQPGSGACRPDGDTPVNIEGRGQITARDLLINALRMRPDRIIVGEVRGGESARDAAGDEHGP
jgi:pilus assembly protein CpaF